jgi:hypothetical protein
MFLHMATSNSADLLTSAPNRSIQMRSVPCTRLGRDSRPKNTTANRKVSVPHNRISTKRVEGIGGYVIAKIDAGLPTWRADSPSPRGTATRATICPDPNFAKKKMATQMISNWNQIVEFLQQIAMLQAVTT